MQYFQCKCGNYKCSTSMGVNECASCEDCGSNLAQGPGQHEDPKPHEFSLVSQVDTDEGPKPLSHCKYCHETKAQIEKRRKYYADRKAEKEKR